MVSTIRRSKNSIIGAITKNKHLSNATNASTKGLGWAVSQGEKNPLREDAHKGLSNDTVLPGQCHSKRDSLGCLSMAQRHTKLRGN